MEPVDQRGAQPQAQSAQPAAPQASGFLASLGGIISSFALAHDKTDATKRKINWEITPCGQLIQDFSHQATVKIIAQANSSFVTGGQNHIEQALKDMLGEVFLTFATKGEAHPENMTNDQLADHFLASIITVIAAEFESKPDPHVNTKQSFENIARTLLKEAFPKELEDPHLPKALREILTGKGMYAWAAGYFIDTKQFNWNQMIALFAEHLEAIYKSLTNPVLITVDNSKFPGVVKFTESLVKQIDSTTKEIKQIQLTIPLLNNDSNAFVKDFLTRLLRNDIKYQKDVPVLTNARLWLVKEIKEGMNAVMVTLLEPAPEQTTQARRLQIAERLLGKASTSLPEMVKLHKDNKTLPEPQLKELIKAHIDDKEKSFFHEKLKSALTAIEAARVDEKPVANQKAQRLLLDITSYYFVESLLAKELDLNKLQKLLPPTLPLKAALEQLYDFLSPFVADLLNQWKDIVEKGESTDKALKLQGGAEIAQWIDKLLKMAKKMIETKAQAGTFQPSGFEFLDEMLCHVLKPSSVPALIEAKDFTDAFLKELITIIVFKAIEKNRKGAEPIAKTLAGIVNSIFEQGQKAILDLQHLKKTTAITKEQSDAFLARASRDIISTVLTKELFNELMPAFLRDFSLWESATDLFTGYLKGVSAQAEQIQSATQSGKLELKVPEVRVLVQTGIEKLLAKLNTPIQADTTIDQIKAQVLQGPALQSLLMKLVPTMCESILAYHLNPTAGESAEDRAAKLFLTLMSIAQKGLDEIDSFDAAQNKQEWRRQFGYTNEIMESYRKTHDIAPDKPIDMKEFLLRSTSKKLVDALLPKSLATELIPKEFAIFNIEQQIANLSYDYLKQAYDYAFGMKALAVTGVSGEPQMLQGIDTFIQKQLQTLLAASPSAQASWMQKVVQKIYSTQDASQKAMLHHFGSNMLFGALGFIFANAKSIPGANGNLLKLLAPIAVAGQKSFHILNDKQKSPKEIVAILKITEPQIRVYLQAIGKPILPKQAIDYDKLNVRQLAYFTTARAGLEKLFNEEQWKALIPEFIQPLFTKDTAGTFACPIIEMIHNVQELLQKRSIEGLKLAAREPELKDYIHKKVSSSISEVLFDLGTRKEPLSITLPPLLDSLLKQIFVDETTDFGDIRNLLVSRVVFTVVEGLVADPQAIIPKLEALVGSFNRGDAQATAAQLIHTAFPKEFFELPLAKLIVDEIALPEVTEDLMQIQKSVERLQEQGREARTYLEKLDGVPELLNDMLKSLDDTLKEMSENETEKVTKELPKFIDDQLKLLLKSKELGPKAQKALHALLFICLRQAITPKPGQTVQERALEVTAKFVSLFNKEMPDETGVLWLKELLPEKTLQNLLPEFLRPVVTHEKLVRWFFKPYVQEVVETAAKVKQEAEAAPTENVTRMQQYAKKWLIDFTKPSATKRGLAGYQGVVREVEKRLLETLSQQDPLIGKNLDTYVDATVAQIIRTLEASGRLRPDFLSDGLAAALPMLSQDAPVRADMPVGADAFNKQAATKLLSTLFPGGKESLTVPDVAKRAVWGKLERAMETLFADLTKSDRRILWTLDRLIPHTTQDQKVIGRRRQEIEDMRVKLLAGEPDPNFMKKAEAMVKDYTMDAAVREAEAQMEKSSLWGPIKWLAKQAVKLTTYVAVRFSVADRVWNFLKDDRNDAPIRNFLWNFLNFTPAAVPKQKEALKTELKDKFHSAFASTELLPWILRGPLSSTMADYYNEKTFVQLVT